jgi:hypothetical protein
VYVPNGVVMDQWTPATEGAAYEFTPSLAALEPFRDRLTILTGLNSITPPGYSHGHPGASTRFLTDVPPKPTRGSADIHAGISMDQILAKEFGRNTQFGSLELGLESSESAGTCFVGFSCAYTTTISWAGPTTPLPTEYDPRAVFERLFGDSSTTDATVLHARMREDSSILDSVTQELTRLERGLGAGDRTKLNEYFAAIRDIERRIQMAEGQNARELPAMEHPGGVPDVFEDHIALMYDLFALAYQVDLTRVVTFMLGREQSGRTFPVLGIPDAHHAISHHGGDPVSIAKCAKVNGYEVALFAKFVDAGSHDSDVRRGHERQPGARPHESPGAAARRRERHAQERAAYPVRERHAVGESARDSARQARRSRGQDVRQHGSAWRTQLGLPNGSEHGCSCSEPIRHNVSSAPAIGRKNGNEA